MLFNQAARSSSRYNENISFQVNEMNGKRCSIERIDGVSMLCWWNIRMCSQTVTNNQKCKINGNKVNSFEKESWSLLLFEPLNRANFYTQIFQEAALNNTTTKAPTNIFCVFQLLRMVWAIAFE